MSNRVKGFVVALKEDMLQEDAERLQKAIEWFNGVVAVTPVLRNSDDFINRSQIRQELGNKLWEVLYPKDKL